MSDVQRVIDAARAATAGASDITKRSTLRTYLSDVTVPELRAYAHEKGMQCRGPRAALVGAIMRSEGL